MVAEFFAADAATPTPPGQMPSMFATAAAAAITAAVVGLGMWSTPPVGSAPPSPAIYVAAAAAGFDPALRAVVDSEMAALEAKLLPRAQTDTCKQRIVSLVNHTRHRFDRGFARHAFAEQHCPVTEISAVVGNERDYSTRPWADRQPQKPKRLAACEATLAFAIELVPGSDRVQLQRLLERILRPSHVYAVTIDPSPAHTTADGEDGVASLGAYVRERVATVPGAHLAGVLATDVVYQGQSLLRAQLVVLRALLAKGVPRWDFVINLSGADYPIRSVEFMARSLAAAGPRSYTEAWLQVPGHGNGRDLWAWFVECFDDPCKGRVPLDKCQGYVYQYGWRAKPPLAPAREFGGSAFWVLHREMVASMWACLDDLPPGSDEDDAFPAVRYLLETVAKQSPAPAPLDVGGTAAATPSVHDLAYCRSVRGIYQWMDTAYDPAELFMQTILYNSQHCSATGAGNLHWVSWDQRTADTSCNKMVVSGDYPNRRPGCLAVKGRDRVGAKAGPMLPSHAWSVEDGFGRRCTETPLPDDFPQGRKQNGVKCEEEYQPVFGRKFSRKEPRFEQAMDVADAAAATWDRELNHGLYKCPA